MSSTIWLWFLNPNFVPPSPNHSACNPPMSSPRREALLAVTLITAWWSHPQAMLLFLGALQTIPRASREPQG